MSHMEDLLQRINALTDDQLRLIADRDDASGVLASYRLAELRGLPAPDRTAIIRGDGFVIVAMNGKIERYETNEIAKIIRREDSQYCVYSEDGDRSFGCYDTMAEAEERLRQIHIFRELIREGTFVSWNSSGGTARGQVEHVMYEGVLGIPGSDFQINAEPGDPAVLIRIWRKGSDGWAATETLVGHKMSTLNRIEPLNKESYKPPKDVQEAAQRALDWIAEGHAGGGFTDVGRARAAQLARGDAVSEQTIRRMRSYLARHEVDSRAEGWNNGEDGFPSPGRVAWDAWGGDPGKRWADMMVERFERTEKDEHGLTPKEEALYEAYEDVVDAFGIFTQEEAHYVEDNPFAVNGMKCAYCVFWQGDNGCEIVEGNIDPNAICKLWVIPQEYLTDAEEKTKSLSADSRFLRKDAYQKFTLGPLYVPEFMDAHGEWTDADELQRAVWGWVKSGDRTIYLQHDRDVRAGEWVEVMTMPQPWTVEMLDPQGNNIGEVTYPAGTVFLGVQWDDAAWKQILNGELRGYSIGGFSDRVLADLPPEAQRDGIDMPTEKQSNDIAKTIAAAVADAMKQTQPIVNVVMPEQRTLTRKIERDEQGNIARIVEVEE